MPAGGQMFSIPVDTVLNKRPLYLQKWVSRLYLSSSEIITQQHVSGEGCHASDHHNDGSHTNSYTLEISCSLQDLTLFISYSCTITVRM